MFSWERSDLADPSLLPDKADSITLFVNPRSEDRDHLTICLSFDSGKTWAQVRQVHEGRNAYSSLAFSKTEQKFYLLYELGENDPYDQGIMCACFDLEWILTEEVTP